METAYQLTITNDHITRKVTVRANTLLSALEKSLSLIKEYSRESAQGVSIDFRVSSFIE
jgi:hypothetical protein